MSKKGSRLVGRSHDIGNHTSHEGPNTLIGETLKLRVGAVVAGGAASARLEDGRFAFVHYAAPGELVEARVEAVHAGYVEAVTTCVVERAASRVEPRCPLFGQCGGCQLQHLSYEAQLEAKAGIVREQLRRIGHIDEDVVAPIVGAKEPWGYRNHVRFSTGRRHGDLGFVPRGGRGLLRVDSCPIAHPCVDSVLGELQGKGAGLHQVQVRCSGQSGSLLIAPAVPGAEIATGQREYTEVLGGREFVVSAPSFFQVNNAQAEELVGLVGSELPARGRVLIDAFAGVGTFAALFASRFERVIAIEESATAIRDARRNLVDIANVEICQGKVEAVLPGLDVAPDAVLLDPPRAGCFPAVIEALAQFRPGVIVYVSCDPATLARDAALLVERGFRLERVTPLDMFPQTAHIECVAQFRQPGG